MIHKLPPRAVQACRWLMRTDEFPPQRTPMSFTDWLPSTPPQLGRSCDLVFLKNNIIQIDYELQAAIGTSWVHRTWTLVSAERINEAHKWGMPMKGVTQISIEAANQQIRELMAEGRRLQGTLGAWVLVDARHQGQRIGSFFAEAAA